MGEIRKTIDLNAHIENIECKIETTGNAVRAVISFDNLGYGTVTAVKFNAQGFNSFGDIIRVNGQDRFFLIVQDISIGKNCHADGLKANLPNGDIRKLTLKECQICYADGSVATYTQPNAWDFTLQTFEGEEAEALGDEYGYQFDYAPIEFDTGWVCGCGRYNRPDEAMCSKCGNAHEHVMQLNTPGYVSELIEKHRSKEQERQAQAAEEDARKAEERKRRSIKIGIGCVVAVVLALIIGNIIKMSGRTTYDSASEMKEAVQGTYSYYDDYGKVSRQITISGDNVSYDYSFGGHLDSEVREWRYKKGIVRTFEDIIVTKDGNLMSDGDLYERGGRMVKETIEPAESAYSVLKISNLYVTSNSSYTVCTGSVTNTGNKTYKFIEVKGSFKDSSGTVLDTDSTYAVGSEGLAPNESSTFRLSVPLNYNIKSCYVSVYKYD